MDVLARARPYLAELSAMAGEASRSNDARVVRLALAVVERQPEQARELLREESRPSEVERFLSWLETDGPARPLKLAAR
jgi:hypothetical protein